VPILTPGAQFTSTMKSIKNDENELSNNSQNSNSSWLNHFLSQPQNIQDPSQNRNNVSGQMILFPSLFQNQPPDTYTPMNHVQGHQNLTLSSIDRPPVIQDREGMLDARQYQAIMDVVQLNQMTFQNSPLFYRLDQSNQYHFSSLQNQHTLGSMINPQLNSNSFMGIKNETAFVSSPDYNVNQAIAFDQNQATLANFSSEATDLFTSQLAAQAFPTINPVQKVLNSFCQSENSANKSGTTSDNFGTIEPFPERLHRLLRETARRGMDDIISFNSDGKSFQIHKPDRFFKEIMPNYFRQNRLSSFKRQLNLYGFDLISVGALRGSYRHENFLRDKPELCRLMRRRDTKLKAKSCIEQKLSSDD
jgi:HSF-type DNA-binding